MASELGIQTIQHTNGTDAITINASGHVHIPGSVVQVQYREYKDAITISNSGTKQDTGLSHVITPRYANSIIKVEFHIGIFSFYTGNTMALFASRGGTEIAIGNANGNRPRSTHRLFRVTTDQNHGQGTSIVVMDAPNSTSQLTYKLVSQEESNGTAYINRDGSYGDNNNVHESTTCSTVILTEIAQ